MRQPDNFYYSPSDRSCSKQTFPCIKGCVGLALAVIVVGMVMLANAPWNFQGPGGDKPGGILPNATNVTTIVPDPLLTRSFYGIDYTPHGSQFDQSCNVTQGDVIEDLKVLSQLTSRVRLYGMDCNQAEYVLQGIQTLKLDMGVLLTVWVDGNMTTYGRQNDTLFKVVKKFGPSHILGVSVGNEAVFRRQITAKALVGLIKDVRAHLTKMGYPEIPVYTTEIEDLDHLIPEEDAVLDNVHPFFAGALPQDAANWTWQYFYNVDQYPTMELARARGLAATQAKPAIISEIGWPTFPAERRIMGAVPSVENQQILLDTFVCEANRRGLPYFWFEFKDQPWKASLFNETREAFWGLFDKDRQLKPARLPNCTLPAWKVGDRSVPQPKPLGDS